MLGKKSCFIGAVILIIVVILITVVFLNKNILIRRENAMNAKDVKNFELVMEEKSIDKIDITPIIELKLPEDIKSLETVEWDKYPVDNCDKIVMDGINQKLNLKLNNGIKEMISCTYGKDILVTIDLRQYCSIDDAKKWYEVDFKHANGIVTNYNDSDKQIYTANAHEEGSSSVFSTMEFQEGKLLVIITESRTIEDNSNIDNSIKILTDIFSDLK